MVDAQPVAEDALQTLHHLYRQCYLGHEEEHLLLPLQRTLYQLDVYLRLAARCHTVQQRHPVLEHRHQDGVVSLLLGRAEWLHQFGVVFPTVVQPPYFHLVGFQQLSLLQLFDGLCRCTADVHQFLAGHLLRLDAVFHAVPPRQFKIGRESLQLFLGSRQHVQGNVQRRHMAVLLRQPDIDLCLGTVAVFSLQSCGQGSLIDIADGRQVVVADPVPQLQLCLVDDRQRIHHRLDVLHFVTLRRCVVHAVHNADVRLAATEAHEYAHAHLYRHTVGHGVGKRPLQGHRQYDVSVSHPT